MAESAFMLRQRKLLEEIKKNNGAPPLKSIYGPPTETNKLDLGDREAFSTRPGLATFSAAGANMEAPTDSPFLRSMNEVDKPTSFAAPISTEPKINQLPNKTPFEDRAANNLLYSENTPETIDAPLIREKQNSLRDQELGKMTSSAAANENGGITKTFNIGGNTLSYNTEDAPEGSFTAGGTDRTLSDLRQPTGAAAEYEHKFRNMGTNQRVAEPTVSSERLKQWDFQQGLKSGRTQKARGPYAGMGAKAKRELMNIREKNKQSGLNNAATNATASERNDILRDNNYLQSQVKQRPESMKVKRYDPISGNVIGEDIVTANADGTYPGAISNQIKTPSPASKALMISMKGDKAHEAEYVKRFGKLPY